MPQYCSIFDRRMQQNSSIPIKVGVAAMFFQRLEDLRIDADKTQEEIAQYLTCKREVYRRYEKGINELPVWALIRLAVYYQTSTDYILGLTNIRTPYTPHQVCVKKKQDI